MKRVIVVLMVTAGAAALTAASTGVPLQFTDITTVSGVKFTHNSGRAGQKWLPESLGSGTAIFDADGDGALDILLVNGRNWKHGGRRTLQANGLEAIALKDAGG